MIMVLTNLSDQQLWLVINFILLLVGSIFIDDNQPVFFLYTWFLFVVQEQLINHIIHKRQLMNQHY